MIKTKITKIVNIIAKKLHEEDLNNILEFIDVNESEIAFELLCTQIYEYNIEINDDIYMQILSCAKDLETPESYTTPLKSLIKYKNQ